MSREYEAVQRRWQRRYVGRRWVLGIPIDAEPIGSMVDDMLAFDIAQRRVLHALRPGFRSALRALKTHIPPESV